MHPYLPDHLVKIYENVEFDVFHPEFKTPPKLVMPAPKIIARAEPAVNDSEQAQNDMAAIVEAISEKILLLPPPKLIVPTAEPLVTSADSPAAASTTLTTPGYDIDSVPIVTIDSAKKRHRVTVGPKRRIAEKEVIQQAPLITTHTPTKLITLPLPEDRLTYGNLAVWLARRPPLEVIGRRRSMNQSILQTFLDDHGGQRLPMAREPWAFILEKMIADQDPTNSLVTVQQALRALRDPVVVKAIGWKNVPYDNRAA